MGIQVDNEQAVDTGPFPFEAEGGTGEVSSQVEPAPPKPAEPAPTERKTGIAVRDGLLVPRHSGELMAVAKTLLDSRALPAQFQNVAQVAMGMQVLRQLGLPEIVGMRQLAIINGAFAIWGELPKALCEKSGLLEDDEEFWFDKDYRKICFGEKNLGIEVFGSYSMTKRKGRKPVERTFTVDDAKKAGLWGNQKKEPWIKYPRRMLQMKARGHALKDVYPDVLMGVSIAEYDHDVIVSDGKLVGEERLSPGGAAAELNAEFLGDAK
jgi:hypothetical protein